PKFKEIYDNIKSWPANNVEYVKFCVTLKELEEKYKTKVCRLDDMQICRTCLLKIADELL
ncbi:MAG: hypothetical protein KGN01_05795, partial [Patescibacteria group bacterium]|nr:hypothetical protein [Patescibacteria group bacterium]